MLTTLAQSLQRQASRQYSVSRKQSQYLYTWRAIQWVIPHSMRCCGTYIFKQRLRLQLQATGLPEAFNVDAAEGIVFCNKESVKYLLAVLGHISVLTGQQHHHDLATHQGGRAERRHLRSGRRRAQPAAQARAGVTVPTAARLKAEIADLVVPRRRMKRRRAAI